MENTKVEIIEEDQYHNPGALETLATVAKALGWVVLVIAILFLGSGIYYTVTNNTGGPLIQTLLGFFINFLFSSLILFFISVFLMAVSEGIYVLLDIAENTRQK